MNPLAPLAADSRSLDGLRAEAARDPQAAIRKAANQFEALFMRQVLKSMRDAMPRSGMWDGPAQSIYEDMFDAQLAQTVAGRRGGLADVIARQLSGNVKGGLEPEAVRVDGALPPLQARARAMPVPATGQTPAGARAPEAPGRMLPSKMPDLARLSERQAGFVREMWPHALLAEQSTGVPAAWIVGQAALESGWGRREIRQADGSTSHNLFGIKAGRSWGGASTQAMTTEYVDGHPRRQVERFRAYGSYGEAFIDWARLMTGSARYADVLRESPDVRAFSTGMQRAGYATDPNYGDKLERTINQALMIRRLVL